MAYFTPTIFTDFKEWMIRHGASAYVASSYVSCLRRLLKDLYSNGYLAVADAEKLLDSARRDRIFMLGIEAGIEDAIEEAYADDPMLIKEKRLKDGRCAFRKFVLFTSTFWHGSPTPTTPSAGMAKVKAPAPSVPLWGNSLNKAAYMLSGTSPFSKSDIERIMKKRIQTQGRVTGEKTWLPIRVVKQILGDKWFSDWAGRIINRTKVFVDGNGTSITLAEIAKITLTPSVKEKDLCDVTITTKQGEVRPVYTRTKNGDFVPMVVSGIENISLDHVKPIKDTLIDLGDAGKLPELKKLSDLMKKALRDGAEHNEASLTRAVNKAYPSISDMVDHAALKAEMELIANDTECELMDSKENFRKGARKL